MPLNCTLKNGEDGYILGCVHFSTIEKKKKNTTIAKKDKGSSDTNMLEKLKGLVPSSQRPRREYLKQMLARPASPGACSAGGGVGRKMGPEEEQAEGSPRPGAPGGMC